MYDAEIQKFLIIPILIAILSYLNNICCPFFRWPFSVLSIWVDIFNNYLVL